MLIQRTFQVIISLVVVSGCRFAVGSTPNLALDSQLPSASISTMFGPTESTSDSAATDDSIILPPAKSPRETVDEIGMPRLSLREQGFVSASDALSVVGSEPSASSSWPLWRRGVKRWQWVQIPGSDLSTVRPETVVPGNLRNRIDAWNGLAADIRGGRLFSAGNGGHADYSGNEVYQIDLSRDTPRWELLREPSKPEDIVASRAASGTYYDYYLDGRPSSTHTYYALHYLASHDAIFKFGAGAMWGTGNEQNWKTDSFLLRSKDWQPAGTWPDVVPGSRKHVTGASICMNPATEEVYVAAPRLRRFNPKTGTFTILGARWPQNSSAVFTRGCAVDPVRNRVVFFGDAYKVPSGGLVYDIASDTISRISFTGDGVSDITAKDWSNFAWYEPRLGKFLLKTQVADHVYAIDPTSFKSTRITTTGGELIPKAKNGVQTRWQRMATLGGYAYYARHGNGIWFLAVE